LVALDVADIAFSGEGLVVTLRRTKTDQEGKGVDLGIPYGAAETTCPVLAVRAWLEAAGLTVGPLFRRVSRAGRVAPDRLCDKAVALIVKAAVVTAGYDPAAFSGHSLRAGFITSAARAGVPEAHIQNQSRHKSLLVLRGYVRRGSLFNDNAAARVGL
jgi:integrase